MDWFFKSFTLEATMVASGNENRFVNYPDSSLYYLISHIKRTLEEKDENKRNIQNRLGEIQVNIAQKETPSADSEEKESA
jgi:hypothetical protein